MARIDVVRRLLIALRCHLRRIGSAGNAARAELVTLNIVFRTFGFAAVGLNWFDHADGPSRGDVRSNAPAGGVFRSPEAQDDLERPILLRVCSFESRRGRCRAEPCRGECHEGL
ncbi:hypothetical protein BRAS3843_670080 [Bradyrhizobium sp. STM 3843]|nr:hypothetical protein BRAS3843_670080 [Bradyrhizobium sp. STM 3843]